MLPLRDDSTSRSRYPALKTILALNILVFAFELLLGPGVDQLLLSYGLIPLRLFDALAGRTPLIPALQTLFSNLFLHGGFIHLAGNMLFLYIFGKKPERHLGSMRFLFFYLGGGLAANLAQITCSLFGSPHLPIIGASGAVAGVLGAYIILFPGSRILTLIFLPPFLLTTIRLPALFVLAWWFIIQLFNGLLTIGQACSGGGVAWFAHIGGFLYGFYLARRIRKRKRFRVIIK